MTKRQQLEVTEVELWEPLDVSGSPIISLCASGGWEFDITEWGVMARYEGEWFIVPQNGIRIVRLTQVGDGRNH